MHNELEKLRKITETLTSNGYLIDQTKEWEYAFDAVPELVFVANPKFIVRYINDSLANRLGIKEKKEVFGLKCHDMLGFGKPMLPVCSEVIDDDVCEQCVNDGECIEKKGDTCNFGEHMIPSLEGVFEFTRSAIKSKVGKLLGYICVLRDVTEARISNKSTAALLKLHTVDCPNDEGLARFILEQIVDLTDSEVGYLHFVDDNGPDDVKLDLFIWSKDTMIGCEANPTRHYPLEEAGIWADCIRQRKTVVHNDYATAEGKQGLPEGHFPLIRHMSVPIFDDNKIVAVAGVGNKKISYTQLDIDYTSITLSNMWTAMKRKQVERELIKSEHSIAELTKLTKTAIYEIDFQLDRFTYVNDAMCEHTGYTREELLSIGPTAMLTEKAQLKWLGRFEAFERGEDVPNSVEYQAKLKDGSYAWVLCSTDFRTNDEGKVIGARVIAIDVTEQRNAENKVKNILEASPFGVHMYKYTGQQLIFAGANPAADRILEVDNTIYSGMPLAEAFPSLETLGVPEKYIGVMKTGETWSATIDYIDDNISGSFEVHAFKTSENTMAAMFKQMDKEQILETKVKSLKTRLQETERECRMLADYLTVENDK